MGSQGVLLSQDKRGRRVPPSNDFSIDWSHPLTNSLVFLWLPGLSPVPQYGLTTPRTQYGYYENGAGTKWGMGSDQRGYIDVPASSPLSNANFSWPASIAVVHRQTTISGASSSCDCGLTAGGPPYFSLTVSSNVDSPFIGYGSGTTTYSLYFKSDNAGSRALILGDHVNVGVVASGSQQCYVDGVLTNTATASLSKPTQTSPQISLQCAVGSPTRYVNDTTALLAIWKLALTAQNVAEFSADPFCFLRY